MKSLDYIDPGDSGLKSFNKAEFNQKLNNYKAMQFNPLPDNYLRLLGLFLLEQFSQLEEIFSEDPSLVASVEIKTLKILNSLMLSKEISSGDIFPFFSSELSLRRKIGKKISENLLELYESINKHCSNFIKLETWLGIDFWKLSDNLPELKFSYCKYIIEKKLSKEYPKLETTLQSYANNVADTFIEEILQEKFYLESFYYRTIGDEAKAELALLEYRKIYNPDPETHTKIKAYGNENFYSADSILDNWSKVLEETDRIQREVERKAGLLNSTCEYFHCSDCCSNTFPSMTLTEYKYLTKWLDENNYPIAKIQERANAIQEAYQKEYGKKLEIVDKEIPENNFAGSENPHNYKFSCPFLDNGRCTCHPARPLICRGFGLATDNKISIKTCKYYLTQYQHNSSPDNERHVYDLAAAQMLAASSDRHLTNKEEGKSQHLKGTIAAWFSTEN